MAAFASARSYTIVPVASWERRTPPADFRLHLLGENYVAQTYRRENEFASIEFARTGCNHSETDTEHADERDRLSSNAGSYRAELHAVTDVERFVECPNGQRTKYEHSTNELRVGDWCRIENPRRNYR